MVEGTRSTKMTLYYTSPTNIQWISLNFGELPCISVWKIITGIIASRNRYNATHNIQSVAALQQDVPSG